jgi:signal transduction histidine kinase
VKPARPPRGALGLRGRIVGAVLVTTVATLAVAAIALLGPLEHSLRDAALNTLKSDVNQSSTSVFRGVDPGLVLQDNPAAQSAHSSLYAEGVSARRTLLHDQSALGTRAGAAAVVLLGLPEPSGSHARIVVVWPADSEIAHDDDYGDAPKAFRTGNPVYTIGSVDGTEYARAAIPFTTPSEPGEPRARWILEVRKPLDEVNAAVHAVRTAFLYAALAGLGLTLILAIPLSGRLVRRLRRLRQAALELAQGGPSVAVPEDRARDEVGDLARTFALMQRRLQQQEVARRAFVATASHELRTPLTSLDGMLELLDEDLGSGDVDVDDARVLLTRARAQSRRLGRLAADLLDLSRIDAQVQLRSEPVELGELSRAVLAEFELGTAERGIQTALEDSPGSVWALGDPGSVAQILRILLDNAVRISPPGGEIRVELLGGVGAAALSVRDQGPGVPNDEGELIFERFQRGRTASGQAGFGLGLAIGRELAERMGGELVLEETDLPGATFTLKLPIASAPEADRIAVV